MSSDLKEHLKKIKQINKELNDSRLLNNKILNDKENKVGI